MGISLFGLTPAATYPSLIKFGDNSAISGVLRALSDGLGNDLPMQVSTTGVNFTGTVTGIPSTPPSGVSGAIQFSNGSAFASDAANLFWDDTNNRLGIGTNAPSFPVDVAGEIRSTTQVSAGTTGTNGVFALRRTSDGATIGSFSTSGNEVLITEFSGSGGRLVTGFGTTALKWLGSSSQPRIGVGFNGSILATTHIQGSGSTSATTSLLVQNSAGTQIAELRDDLTVSVRAQFRVLDTLGNNAMIMFGDGYGGIKTLWVNGSLGLTLSPGNNASARLQVDSTTQGVLFPRMTTTQRDAIATPATGLRIYNTTTNTNDTYNGTVWQSNSVSGVAGAIQFSNGSAFASDAANLFWDDTNNRLGVGTNAPTQTLDVNGSAIFSSSVTSSSFRTHIVQANNSASNGRVALQTWDNMIVNVEEGGVGIAKGVYLTPSAQVHIRGNGSTSATTSLLVQNSAGTAALTVKDDCSTNIGASGISAKLNIVNINGSVAAFLAGSGNGGVVEFNSISGAGIRCNDGYGNTNMFLGGLSTPSVSIGKASSAVASALLEMVSTTKGFLPPVMTTTQKNAIATPAAGLVVYDSTTNKLNYNNGTVWKEVTPDGYTGLVTVNATPPVTFDIQNGIIVNVI